MQATFFIALAVASRLGTAALAAHQIVAQLWLLTSYVTDGFAVAGTVLGSRLSHQRHTSADSNDARYTTHVTCMLTCVWSAVFISTVHVYTQGKAQPLVGECHAFHILISFLCSKHVCLSMCVCVLQKPSDPVQTCTAEWSCHRDSIWHSILCSSRLAHFFIHPKSRHYQNPAPHPLATDLPCSASELSCLCI